MRFQREPITDDDARIVPLTARPNVSADFSQFCGPSSITMDQGIVQRADATDLRIALQLREWRGCAAREHSHSSAGG
jgi:hypothetical protein